jgi:MFS family permease
VTDPPDWPALPRVVRPDLFTPPRPPREPTFGEALRPLLPLYALDVLTAFTVGMLPPILPLVAAEWALSPVEVGLVNTAYALGRLGGSYPASLVRARWGTRAAVFLGLAGLVGGAFLCGVVPRFSLFLLARVVMGLGSSLCFLAIFAELLESSPAASRGRLANAFEATAILSLAVGSSLAAALAQTGGWRAVFVVAGVFMLPAALTWGALGAEAGRNPTPSTRGRWVSGAELRSLAPVYAASLTMAATWSGLFYTLVPLVGHDRYGLDAATLGLALGAGYVAELLGLLGIGLVIDRLRREPLFLGGACSVALGALILGLGARPVVFVAGLVLVGGGFSVWMIPATVLADRAGTPLPPAHLAAFRIAMDTGMILGPLAFGGMAELAGEGIAVAGSGLVLLAEAIALARR